MSFISLKTDDFSLQNMIESSLIGPVQWVILKQWTFNYQIVMETLPVANVKLT